MVIHLSVCNINTIFAIYFFNLKYNHTLAKLYLIPTSLHENDTFTISNADAAIVSSIRTFIVENEKSARRVLRAYVPLPQLELLPLNEHTQPEQFYNYLAACKEGLDVGLLSDCGCPAVCDPGADIVAMAHTLGIEVVPMVGPSSILLALMASGLSGQKFENNGYVPIKEPDRQKKIREIENKSRVENSTQIFIEAPYRNHQLFEVLLKTLRPQTRLCIAVNINTPNAIIKTKEVAQWQKSKPDINKKPCVFLLMA